MKERYLLVGIDAGEGVNRFMKFDAILSSPDIMIKEPADSMAILLLILVSRLNAELVSDQWFFFVLDTETKEVLYS